MSGEPHLMHLLFFGSIKLSQEGAGGVPPLRNTLFEKKFELGREPNYTGNCSSKGLPAFICGKSETQWAERMSYPCDTRRSSNFNC